MTLPSPHFGIKRNPSLRPVVTQGWKAESASLFNSFLKEVLCPFRKLAFSRLIFFLILMLCFVYTGCHPRLEPSLPCCLTHIWRRKKWIHVFYQGISVKVNATGSDRNWTWFDHCTLNTDNKSAMLTSPNSIHKPNVAQAFVVTLFAVIVRLLCKSLTGLFQWKK